MSYKRLEGGRTIEDQLWQGLGQLCRYINNGVTFSSENFPGFEISDRCLQVLEKTLCRNPYIRLGKLVPNPTSGGKFRTVLLYAPTPFEMLRADGVELIVRVMSHQAGESAISIDVPEVGGDAEV